MNYRSWAAPFVGVALLAVGCARTGAPEGRSDARTELDHLIIQEAFYVGHSWYRDLGNPKDASNPQLYDEDQYLIIYNPTQEVLYLDGLALTSSALDPGKVVKIEPKDEFVGRYFGAGTVVYFPGSGREHPLAPGQRVVIAKYAIDHTKDFLDEQREGAEEEGDTFDAAQYKGVETFLDLSKADFEWTNRDYLSGEEQRKNNPAVPDLLPLVTEDDGDGERSALYSFGEIAEQGGLALVKLPWTPEAFRKEYQEKKEQSAYLHQLSVLSTHHKNTLAVFEIPFSHVLDCLTISPQQGYLQRVTKLDKGYLAVSDQLSGTMKKADYPKFVGMALLRRTDGHGYVDEGNTRTDFEVKPASLSRPSK